MESKTSLILWGKEYVEWAKIDPVTNTENKMQLKNICFSGLFSYTILHYLLVTMHNNQWTIFSHLSFSYL